MPYQIGGAPPGLRGYLMSRANQQADQQAQMQAAQQAMGLQGLLMQQQMMPIQLEKARLEMKKARELADLKRQILANIAGGQQAGGQPVEGGISTPTGPSTFNGQPAPQAPSLGLPPQVQLGLLSGDPGLKAWAQELAKVHAPTDKIREAIALGLLPGTPEFNSFIGRMATQGGIWNPTAGGGVQLAPGMAEGAGAIRAAEEAARARYDLVTAPPTSPNAPPVFRSRADILGMVQPSPQPAISPAPQQVVPSIPPQVQAERDRIAADIRRREVQPEGGGMIPSAAILPNAAGMSPNQKAEVAGTERFKETSGSESAKLAVGLTDAAQKAENQLASIDAIRVAVDEIKAAGGSVGAFQPMVKRATELVQGLGIDPASLGLPKDAGPYQVLDALTNKMALGLIGVPGGMPANLFSEADRKFVQASVARPVDTEQGLNAKLEIFEKMNRRQIEQEQSWLAAQEQGKTYNQWRMDWAKHVKDNSLFKREDMGRIIQQTRPATNSPGRLSPQEKAELDALRRRFRK